MSEPPKETDQKKREPDLSELDGLDMKSLGPAMMGGLGMVPRVSQRKISENEGDAE